MFTSVCIQLHDCVEQYNQESYNGKKIPPQVTFIWNGTEYNVFRIKGHYAPVYFKSDKFWGDKATFMKNGTAAKISRYANLYMSRFISAAHGDKHSLAKVLVANGNANEEDYFGYSLIVYAAANGRKNTVKMLLRHGAEINKVATCGYTPLLAAIEKEHHKLIGYLLKRQSIQIDVKGRNDMTALHIAAQAGDSKTIKLLLSKDADLESSNSTGNTPLSLAAYNGHTHCVEMLLRKGAKFNHLNKSNQTPLELARIGQHKQCVELLSTYSSSQQRARRGNFRMYTSLV